MNETIPQAGKVTIVPTVRLTPEMIEELRNAARGPGVVISEIDPDELSKTLASTDRFAVDLLPNKQCSLSLKLPRKLLIEAVRAAREVPLVWQEVILAEITVIDPKHDLLRLDFIRHAHGVGSNAVLTVKEI